MKNFLFESIRLVSQREMSGRQVLFDPKTNLVVGRNHTGKSSLIKSLFHTLGAKPQGGLTEWDEGTATAVQFSVDGTQYSAIHQRGYRALFSDGRLIGATGSHVEWSQLFADAVGFNLVLTDKKANSVPAPPVCFFLPFYINQDGSWQSAWGTFAGIQQFHAPVGPILEYFTGIKPPEFYELSAKRTQAQRKLEDLENERRVLERAKQRFARTVPDRTPKVQPENFEHEVTELTEEVTKLNAEQEKLRDSIVREREALANIELQLRLAKTALETYEEDSTFLQREPRELLVCPTCNAEHGESFLDLFNYAEDARVLRELASDLRQNAAALREKIASTEERQRGLNGQYQRVSTILSTRRGDLVFRDVVNSMGAESALRSFEDESNQIGGEIEKKLGEIREMDSQLKSLTSPARSKEILKQFRAAFASALVNLNLHAVDTAKLRLTGRPNLSGSSGPRSILAYYAALWATCLSGHGSFSVPLVIDSPNQQGQDDINLPLVLKFVASNLPKGAQVIVSTEELASNQFSAQVSLTEPYKLLRTEEFDEVAALLTPMLDAMYVALDSASGAPQHSVDAQSATQRLPS